MDKQEQEEQERWNKAFKLKTKADGATRLSAAYLDSPATDGGCDFNGEHWTAADVAYELSMAVRTKALQATTVDLDKLKELVEEAIGCAKSDKSYATLEVLSQIKSAL